MATRSLGQLTIDLIARTGGFEQGMDRAARTAQRRSQDIEQSSQKSSQAVSRSWGLTAAAIQGALAGISVGAIFGQFINETIKAQNEQAQLGAVLRSTGEAAGFNAQQLNAMAEALASATSFSTGELNDAQTTLLAFTGIVGQEFPRALQAAADMASRTGMTVRAAAETIGRALDIPSQGLTSLSRQGFRFTEEQKQLAQQLEATGRTAEAQAIVLEALEESYGGAADAARNTLGGSLQALRNTISTLLTGTDDGVNGLRNAVEGLNEALSSEGAKNALDALAVTAQIVAGVLAARLAASAIAVTSSFVALTIQAGRTQTVVSGMSGVGATAATSFNGMAASARVASSALALLGGPLGAVILAVGGAAYAWREYTSSTRDSASASVRSVADIKTGVDDLVSSYQKLNELQRQQVINIRTEELSESIKEARAAVIELGAAFEPSLSEGTRAASRFRAEFTSEIAQVASDTSLSADQMASSFSNVIDAYIRSGRATEDSRSKLIEFAQKVVEASGNVSGLTQELEALTNAQAAAAGGVAPVVDSLDQYRRNYEKFLKDFATPDERFRTAVEEQRKLLGELYNPDVEARLRDRFLPKTRGGGSASKEIGGLIKQLQLQADTLGMTEAATARYRIEVAKGSEADRNRALALYDQVAAFKQSEEAQEKYKDVLTSLYTDEEKATALLRERIAVLREANISQTEYALTAEKIARGAIEDAPKYGGLDPSIGGVIGELSKIEEAREELEDWHQTQLDMQRSFLDEKLINEETYAIAVSAINQENAEKLTKIQSAYKTTSLSMFADMTSQTVGMLESLGVKGSAAYKVLFLASKAAAIAQAIVNTEEAATKALTLGPILGIPAATLVRVSGYASVAAIAAQTIVGMAHDGIDSVPETGTWLLEKGERVMTSETSAKLDSVLGRAQNGIGGSPIVNIYEDRDRAGQVESRTNANGEQETDIFVADIFGGGRRAETLESVYGLQRVGQ